MRNWVQDKGGGGSCTGPMCTTSARLLMRGVAHGVQRWQGGWLVRWAPLARDLAVAARSAGTPLCCAVLPLQGCTHCRMHARTPARTSPRPQTVVSAHRHTSAAQPTRVCACAVLQLPTVSGCFVGHAPVTGLALQLRAPRSRPWQRPAGSSGPAPEQYAAGARQGCGRRWRPAARRPGRAEHQKPDRGAGRCVRAGAGAAGAVRRELREPRPGDRLVVLACPAACSSSRDAPVPLAQHHQRHVAVRGR